MIYYSLFRELFWLLMISSFNGLHRFLDVDNDTVRLNGSPVLYVLRW
jgi:hypothetical protein